MTIQGSYTLSELLGHIPAAWGESRIELVKRMAQADGQAVQAERKAPSRTLLACPALLDEHCLTASDMAELEGREGLAWAWHQHVTQRLARPLTHLDFSLLDVLDGVDRCHPRYAEELDEVVRQPMSGRAGSAVPAGVATFLDGLGRQGEADTQRAHEKSQQWLQTQKRHQGFAVSAAWDGTTALAFVALVSFGVLAMMADAFGGSPETVGWLFKGGLVALVTLVAGIVRTEVSARRRAWHFGAVSALQPLSGTEVFEALKFARMHSEALAWFRHVRGGLQRELRSGDLDIARALVREASLGRG